MKPLTELTGKGSFFWHDCQQEAFVILKSIMAADCLNAYPDYNQPFEIYTDAEQPIIDSFTAIFSLFATYMVTKKILENWIYWIVIDIVSVYLYFSRDLQLTAGLFAAYTIIALFGYFSWKKQLNTLS